MSVNLLRREVTVVDAITADVMNALTTCRACVNSDFGAHIAFRGVASRGVGLKLVHRRSKCHQRGSRHRQGRSTGSKSRMRCLREARNPEEIWSLGTYIEVSHAQNYSQERPLLKTGTHRRVGLTLVDQPESARSSTKLAFELDLDHFVSDK